MIPNPVTDHLAALNPQQREAAAIVEGPVLILAGAGSGKTRVITYRVAHLIETVGVRPENILAVTFTNKAAGEMKGRIDALLAKYYASAGRTGAPLLSTFHSLCVRILRRDIEKLNRGYNRSFTIYDTDDQQKLIRGILKEMGYGDDKQVSPRAVQSAISAAKNRGEDPQIYASQADYVNERREIIAQVFKVYEQRLQSSNALDFDDLLIRTVQLLRHSVETRDYYHNRFRHVMVDEFQDTNGIQYALVRLIVEGSAAGRATTRGEQLPEGFWQNRSLCVVGDDQQSIYSFRGSDFKIILGFQSDYADAKVIKLEENYRSTKRILETANKVIANNTDRIDKTLFSSSRDGDKVRYAQVFDGDAEARFVVQKIEEHLRREPDLRAAVLYRTNAQSRQFEEACRRAGLRYNLVGGFSFYERSEVKDVIAYLKLALNTHDNIALMRVINTPTRGIGKSTLDDIERRAKDFGVSWWETISLIIEQNLLPARTVNALKSFRDIITRLSEKAAIEGEKLSEIVKAAVIDTGYERALKAENTEEAEARLLNLEELVNAAAEAEENGESLRDFIDHAALASDTDQIDAAAQVTLMTMHAAKGLEFPLVFIAGLEENLFPHSRARESQSDLEEERRLLYVAITRAEKYLYITHALKRRVYGEEMPAEPSRFLNEFPIELIEDISPGPSWLRFANKAATQENQRALRALKGESDYEIEYDDEYRPANRKDYGAGGSRHGSSYGSKYGSSSKRDDDSSDSAYVPPYQPKRTSNYGGKNYSNADSVREFFAKQGKKVDDIIPESGTAKSGTGKGGSSGFRANMRVRHAKYGQGLIIRVEGEGEEAKLTINFPGYGTKKMIAKYAGLEKL
ncbi:MAG TPA: UvrD-helicase domain-containing protein [Blastocatellia bacterium]|nr:UvrD-helicase domain-containing protein [Blastocatellia bacterium]